MHAEFPYAHFLVVIQYPYSVLYCEITLFMKSGARKKHCIFFVNRAIALSCTTIEIPAQNTVY